MSIRSSTTKCNIEIYDEGMETPGVILYHHSDGFPEFMVEKLKNFLKASWEYLKTAGYPYWWDSEHVGSILITLSIEDYQKPLRPFSTNRLNNVDRNDWSKPYRCYGGVPVFQPCVSRHADIDYVYKVRLHGNEDAFDNDSGKFTIEYEEV